MQMKKEFCNSSRRTVPFREPILFQANYTLLLYHSTVDDNISMLFVSSLMFWEAELRCGEWLGEEVGKGRRWGKGWGVAG